jgi:hypothetical protein
MISSGRALRGPADFLNQIKRISRPASRGISDLQKIT